MNKKFLIVLIALSVSLVAVWTLHSRNRKARQTQASQLFAYMDGPLSEYALGATRILPHLGKPGPELAEAKAYLANSAEHLSRLFESSLEGGMKELLGEAVPLHRGITTHAQKLPLKAADHAAWRDEEAMLRSRLIYVLEKMRFQGQEEFDLKGSRMLEMNALIYSLKELGSPSSN